MSEPEKSPGRSLWARARGWFREEDDPLTQWVAQAVEGSRLGDQAGILEALERATGPTLFAAERSGALEAAAHAGEATAFLQLGAGHGEAALRLARALRPDAGRLTLVEPLLARGRAVAQLLDHASLGDRLELLNCAVLDAIPSLYRRFDLILLLHEPEMFLADLRHAERHGRLKPGTRVIAPTTRMASEESDRYLAHVRASGLYGSESHGGFEVSRCLAEIEAW
ncbi:MAG: class I SAM-dependent methyltransferase [Deltaproteobacteria bacterium]|nr:class I SAM-dependent methyltransferase [Deltaproteobacteria bacterium]MBW2395666.1 class I SAM-dependent methyltransferase [Deltaproteobacteria bacterium]